MSVRVVVPAVSIVSLAEAKIHLRVEHDDDNGYIETLIAAAQGWIDGPAGWLGRSVGVQTLEVVDEHPTCPIVRLPYPPIIEVLEASAGGADVPVDGYIPGAAAFSFGMTLDQGAPVRVKYRAGYATPPAPIRVAVLMLAGQWYRSREASTDKTLTEMPFGVAALLAPFRVWGA